jgi:hypothetical protein
LLPKQKFHPFLLFPVFVTQPERGIAPQGHFLFPRRCARIGPATTRDFEAQPCGVPPARRASGLLMRKFPREATFEWPGDFGPFWQFGKKKSKRGPEDWAGYEGRFRPVKRWQTGNQTTCGVAKGELEVDGPGKRRICRSDRAQASSCAQPIVLIWRHNTEGWAIRWRIFRKSSWHCDGETVSHAARTRADSYNETHQLGSGGCADG